MIQSGLSAFSGKNVLLLQGPVGPFFYRLSQDLQAHGAQVHKINLNGGDWLFYRKNSINFRQSIEEWPDFFDEKLTYFKTDIVILFGDCRAYHQIAHRIAQLRGLKVGVFEEGYIRPNFITFEKFGTNGNSQLPRENIHYQQHNIDSIPIEQEVGKTFGYAAMWAMLYYIASTLLWPFYWHYNHHRPLNLLQGLYWVRAYWRKNLYKFTQRNILNELTQQYHKRYFLVPLQVHNDAQIYFHSNYVSVKDFIQNTIESFAANAPKDTLLVIKHHPLDRGYHNYKKAIFNSAKVLGVADRVRYIHDQHLPTLFDHALGVIVVNSTVGFSALDHALSVKTCGKAIYDMPGLTYQGTLDNFWKDALSHKVNEQLLINFQHHVITQTQLNGNFYKRLVSTNNKTGIIWPK